MSASLTNPTLHEFLAAFAAWLADSDGYYISAGRRAPGNRAGGRL